MGSEDRFSAMQIVETLRSENKDLLEKLEALKGTPYYLQRHHIYDCIFYHKCLKLNVIFFFFIAKRAADQEKLREVDRLKIQVETLTEFKTKVLESQNALQRDLKKVFC